MRIVIQRVSEASVTVQGEKISEIGEGVMILIGITVEDGPEDIEWLTGKVSRLRIFDDDEGQMNLSLLDVGGSALVVSQFTLHASTKKGNRPSYIHAARPEMAEPLYESFCQRLEEILGSPVRRGVFGAEMKVALINDGPVTIQINSKQKD